MKKIGLLARADVNEAGHVLRDLVGWLHERGCEALVESRTASLLEGGARPDAVLEGRSLGAEVEALVVLGGDGTLLAACHLLSRSEVPVVGVNFGSLGFLTEVTLGDLYATLQGVLAGDYEHEQRRLLHGVVRRGELVLGEDHVLNDVVVAKASLSRMLELDLSVNGRVVSAFRADGLIVASPTGSTAYNLAAGGPFVHPTLAAMLLTPICPHMLTHRPLVLSDSAQVEIRLKPDPDAEANVTFDGQRGFPLEGSESVTVTRSPRTLRLVKVASRDYFEVLRTKLKWGEPTARRR